MLNATLLNQAPTLKKENNKNSSREITIYDIEVALKELNLEFKRVDEVDIYNIFKYIEVSKKGLEDGY